MMNDMTTQCTTQRSNNYVVNEFYRTACKCSNIRRQFTPDIISFEKNYEILVYVKLSLRVLDDQGMPSFDLFMLFGMTIGHKNFGNFDFL